jgi:hypothetical protein
MVLIYTHVFPMRARLVRRPLNATTNSETPRSGFSWISADNQKQSTMATP